VLAPWSNIHRSFDRESHNSPSIMTTIAISVTIESISLRRV
jgi:hypothetical protein